MGSMTRWLTFAALALAACDGPAPVVDADGGMDAGGGEVDSSTTPPEDSSTALPQDGGPVAYIPGQCTELCEDDDDCAESLGCVSGRCACRSDALCQVGELWFTGCASDDDCGPSRCVEWAGTTYCVPDDTTRFNCGIGSSESKVVVTLADGSGTIETCVDTDIECRSDGTCGVDFRCEDDSDCSGPGPSNTPHCDVATGRCVCVEDPEDSCTARHPGMQCKSDGECGCLDDSLCPASTGGHCDVDTGECGCLGNDDCADSEVCHQGQCRCTVANGCGDVFISPTNPGTTLECIPVL